MAEYFYIENPSQQGKLALSQDVFNDIVSSVIKQVHGVKMNEAKKGIFSSHKPVRCEIKNGKVTSFVEIKVAKNLTNEEIDKLVNTIKEEAYELVSMMTEVVPFSLEVKVVGIDNNL